MGVADRIRGSGRQRSHRARLRRAGEGARADDGLIDYVNLTYGSCLRPHKIMGGMHEPPGYELEAAAPVVAAVESARHRHRPVPHPG